MNKLTEWLVKPLVTESVELPIEIGDTVLMGRFKNKKVKVKSIDYNERGDLLINGRPALKFRVLKKQPDKKLLPHKTTDKGSVSPDADMRRAEDENVVPSPSRKGINKMKRKGNTSVPYGSGYKKVKKLQKELDSYMENVVYSSMENRDSATIS